MSVSVSGTMAALFVAKGPKGIAANTEMTRAGQESYNIMSFLQ
jgi:hypothetical protein